MLRFVTDVPDPRHPGNEDEELEWLDEVEFFPPDLPDLRKDPFGWTPEELYDAARLAKRWLNAELPILQLAA